jgi:hypothetical protein
MGIIIALAMYRCNATEPGNTGKELLQEVHEAITG